MTELERMASARAALDTLPDKGTAKALDAFKAYAARDWTRVERLVGECRAWHEANAPLAYDAFDEKWDAEIEAAYCREE